jgi:hypothetical protein
VSINGAITSRDLLIPTEERVCTQDISAIDRTNGINPPSITQVSNPKHRSVSLHSLSTVVRLQISTVVLRILLLLSYPPFRLVLLTYQFFYADFVSDLSIVFYALNRFDALLLRSS